MQEYERTCVRMSAIVSRTPNHADIHSRYEDHIRNNKIDIF